MRLGAFFARLKSAVAQGGTVQVEGRHEPGVMKVTSTFMRFCLHAWRKDYRLARAIRRTTEELAPDTIDPFASVCGRPKTPDRHSAGLWETVTS